MPRGPRIDSPGLVHHVICRGIERREVFIDSADYYRFLNRLSILAGGENIQVYAFSLMPNHLHLLVRPLRTSLATFMRRLLTGYAVYFNRRHKRSGHLFQNRYKSFVVEEESYLLELIRYIHLNPLRAGIVADLTALSKWPFSGYAALMGNEDRPWLETEEIFAYFSQERFAARRKLAQFMQDGIVVGRRPDLTGGGLRLCTATRPPLFNNGQQVACDERILGSKNFVEMVLGELNIPAHPANCDTSLEQILESVAVHYGLTIPEVCSGSRRASVTKARAAAAYLATKQLALSYSILAQVLSVSASAVHGIVMSNRGELEAQKIRLD